jgi:antitoxin YefM
MDAITYTYARNNLAKTMQQACDNHEPIIVTRENESAVVMMSLEDFQSIEETAYLLRSPKNAKRLLESITQLDNGKGMEKELME